MPIAPGYPALFLASSHVSSGVNRHSMTIGPPPASSKTPSGSSPISLVSGHTPLSSMQHGATAEQNRGDGAENRVPGQSVPCPAGLVRLASRGRQLWPTERWRRGLCVSGKPLWYRTGIHVGRRAFHAAGNCREVIPIGLASHEVVSVCIRALYGSSAACADACRQSR